MAYLNRAYMVISSELLFRAVFKFFAHQMPVPGYPDSHAKVVGTRTP
jgi:hypothetical protein